MLKKSLMILMTTLFFMGSAQAVSNPLMRVCQVNFGVFKVMFLSGSPSNLNVPYKDVAMCDFKSTLIDSLSLMKYRDQGVKSQALRAFLNDDAGCYENGGEIIEKNLGPACLFSDDSVIDTRSLDIGASSLPQVKNTIENLN